MYYFYILYTAQHDRYYIGYTSNYQQRLLQHNSTINLDTYTARYKPWKMVAVFQCGEDKATAIRIEQYIKKQKSRKLLEALIDPNFVPTGKLALLVRVPDSRD